MRSPFCRPRLHTVVLLGALTLASCLPSEAGSTAGSSSQAQPSTTDVDTDVDTDVTTTPLFDDTVVHDVHLSFDRAHYDALIASYAATGDKEWIAATVTIDGHTYVQAGARLKGNSSLLGLRRPESLPLAREPEALPWLIRLDRYVDGQDHQGIRDLVIRSNRTSTSLNEAVALDLLDLAGLPAQQAIAVSFRVGDSEPRLRLGVEHPDDRWARDHFEDDGALYKATSGGDYGWRGTDPAAYTDAFDQKAGQDVTDLRPLVELLEFINRADDAAFAAELGQRFDVPGFATYLAAQDLVQNADDIDGRGNNSYLWYDVVTRRFTVVPWDHNLAFGLGEALSRDDGQAWFGDPREARARPADAAVRWDGPGGSVLVDRFLAVREFDELVERSRRDLTRTLYESGAADRILTRWTTLLLDAAETLVDAPTVMNEAAAIAQYFDPAGG